MLCMTPVDAKAESKVFLRHCGKDRGTSKSENPKFTWKFTDE